MKSYKELMQEKLELLEKLETFQKGIKKYETEIDVINQKLRHLAIKIDENYYMKNIDPKDSPEYTDTKLLRILRKNYEIEKYKLIAEKDIIDSKMAKLNKKIESSIAAADKDKRSTKKKDETILKKIMNNIDTLKNNDFTPSNVAKTINEHPTTVWRKLKKYDFIVLLSTRIQDHLKQTEEYDPSLMTLLDDLLAKIKKMSKTKKKSKEIVFSDLSQNKSKNYK